MNCETRTETEPDAPPLIVVRIPGPPFAQPRARARQRGRFTQVYEPKEAKSWKGGAQVHMLEALRALGLKPPAYTVALDVSIEAVFPCPRSEYRTKNPVQRRPYVGLKDWDNVGKAICDAANGVIYVDDRLIAHADVWCWVGAQEEAPYVEMRVRPFVGEPLSHWQLAALLRSPREIGA